MEQKNEGGKKNKGKGFFGRLLDKLDKKLEEKAKQGKCCCNNGNKRDETCCK